jgi:hypothetical protein
MIFSRLDNGDRYKQGAQPLRSLEHDIEQEIHFLWWIRPTSAAVRPAHQRIEKMVARTGVECGEQTVEQHQLNRGY